MDGSEGAGIGLGILLLLTTALGRIVSGMYGYSIDEYYKDNEVDFGLFSFMELAVFFMEDGAAILLLANKTGGLDIVETTSIYLTMIEGICYILYFIQWWIKIIAFICFCSCCVEDAAKLLCASHFFIVVPAVSFAFQTYILITQVVMSKDDDPPLLGGLEIAAFVVYGITAVIMGVSVVVTTYFL